MPPARGLVYLLIKEHKMSFFNNLLNWFGWGGDAEMGHTDRLENDLRCSINPATGLPTIGGCAGVDVDGNPYGTHFHHDDSWSSMDSGFQNDSFASSSFGNDSFSDSSGMGCGFDSE